MMAKTLRTNKGVPQIENGLKVNRATDVGMRKEAKIVPTTIRFNPSLASARVMLDRIDVPEHSSSASLRRENRPLV